MESNVMICGQQMNQIIPCLIQDLQIHWTNTCQILIRIHQTCLITPIIQHRQTHHQTVPLIHSKPHRQTAKTPN